MPLSVVFLKAAVDCPAVTLPSAYLDPNAGDPTPAVSPTFTLGDTTSVATDLNNLACRIDNIQDWGASGIGIKYGLTLSEGTGLQAAIAAGAISAGQKYAGGTRALTASHDNYLWMLRTGVLASPVIDATTPPAGTDPVYLGVLTCSGTVPTAIDCSGVVYAFPGGDLWRRTGDAGAPGDSLPAGLRLYTRTAGGIYLWDGAAHRLVSDQLPLAGGTLTGNLELDSELHFFSRYKLIGPALSASLGRLILAALTSNATQALSVLPQGSPTYDAYGANNLGGLLELWATDGIADAINFLRLVGFAASDRVGLAIEKGGTGTLQPFVIRMGTSDRFQIGAAGELSFPNIPTADPHVAGQVWANAGVLTVSAG